MFVKLAQEKYGRFIVTRLLKHNKTARKKIQVRKSRAKETQSELSLLVLIWGVTRVVRVGLVEYWEEYE